MDPTGYLKRIDYKGEVSPTFAVLKKLQRKHLYNIPFENLDIHYGNRIVLDIEKIYDKIINQNRGGFCYELNGLFHGLLKSIGFNAKMVSARVYEREQKEFSPEFDHMAVMVHIDQTDYLVDVGFGEFIFNPLKIETGILQNDLREVYRIETYDEKYLQVSKQDNGIWSPDYIFTPRARKLKEFESRCHYHQTSNESHFRQKKICSLPTKSGRLTVTSDKIKIKHGDKTEELELKGEEEFLAALWDHFQIKP